MFEVSSGLVQGQMKISLDKTEELSMAEEDYQAKGADEFLPVLADLHSP